MKKILLTTAICILFVANGFSQTKFISTSDDERKGFVAINLGLSVPTGNFGSKDFNNSEASYAKTGAALDITFGYKLLPNLGFTAMWRNQSVGIDTDKYKQDLENYLENNTNAFYPRAEIEASNFTLSGLMAGFYSTFPISKKVSFDTRVLFGYTLAKTPPFSTVVYEYGTKSLTIKRDGAETAAFSYLIGAGIKSALSEKTYFMFNIDFYSANATWKSVKETAYGHRSGSYTSGSFKISQELSTVNTSVGIGFRF